MLRCDNLSVFQYQRYVESGGLSRYARIPLPYGLMVPGEDHSEKINVVFPGRLDGLSVLDVGCHYGLYLHEARMHGAAIHPPDINRSNYETRIEGRDIYLQWTPPPGRQRLAVAESGLRSADDARDARNAGYDLALVGTALMRSENPAALLQGMLAAGRAA